MMMVHTACVALHLQDTEIETHFTDVDRSTRQNPKMAKYSITQRIFLCAAALIISTASLAEQTSYAPADLYKYETFVLENGLRVFLNNRGESPNVSMRLIVDTGTKDYPCDKRELPHLVEHLMFSGYGEITESDLDRMIARWGGNWNAVTYGERTTYEIQFFSNFLKDVTLMLNMMFQETTVTNEELEAARAIVHAEAGGVAGPIRQYFYKNGIYEGNADRAYRRFVPGSDEWCETLIDANSINLHDVDTYIATQHRPSNMTLIVVGKFEVDAYKAVLDHTFGAMESVASREEPRVDSSINFVPTDYHTKMDSLFGQQGYACLEFGVPQWTAPERATLVLISDYLRTRMFEVLRTERGLSYDPSVRFNNFEDFSTLMLDASVASESIDEAMQVIEKLIEELLIEGIPEKQLDHHRGSRLYRIAAAYESNYSVADFYERNLLPWQLEGEFPDQDSFFADVTTEDTISVARQYLALDKALRYTSRPAFGYGGFAGLAAVPLLAFVAVRVSRRKKNKQLPMD